jgi:hypothetical protein
LVTPFVQAAVVVETADPLRVRGVVVFVAARV